MKSIIQDLTKDPTTHLHYKWKNDYLFRKVKIGGGEQPGTPKSAHNYLPRYIFGWTLWFYSHRNKGCHHIILEEITKTSQIVYKRMPNL